MESLIEHIESSLLPLEDWELKEAGDSITEIRYILEAKEAGAVYVLGRSELKLEKTSSFLDRVMAGTFYPFLNNICRSAHSSMNIPPQNFLEVGMYYDLNHNFETT